MKMYPLSVFFLAALLSVVARAAQDNPQLGAVMKTLSKDLTQIAEPTKAADPASVKDAVLLAAAVRAKTNAYLLQLSVDRSGIIDKGVFVADELSPPGIEAIPVADLQTKLGQYTGYLLKAKGKMVEAETLINAELKKSNPAARNYTALKTALDQLGLIIKEAHGAFKPAHP